MIFEVGMEVKGFGHLTGRPYSGIVQELRKDSLVIKTREHGPGIIIKLDTATLPITNNQDGLMLLRRD